jgi:Protein of unknown function (DUF3999)
MGERSRLFRASVAVAGTGLVAAAAALDLLEFVAGWPIEAPAGAEVFDVPLTAEVYAAADGIEQLAVLDANGEPQPFFRESLAPATSERRVALEASPLYAGTEGGLTVGVTTNAGGTSVSVTPGASAEPATTGFVLDARAVAVAPVALEFDWRALPQPFLLDVGVEQSADLTTWRSVGRASVAALSIGGVEVRHARVPVRAGTGGYFRVTPRGGVADWRLLRATLVSATTERTTTLSVRVPPLPATAVPDDAPVQALYFDAGGPLPVSSATLAFGGGDGWARGDVAASRSLAGPWTTVADDALFYSVSFEGRELAAEPLVVGRQARRYWRVLPSAPPRGERVELVLEFPQERLRVAAGGGAPYLLAAGTLAEQAGPDPTLASVWSQLEPPAAAVPLATLGARRELGGPDALVADWRFPWRTAALWAVLVAGVLVVGAMAVRLAREMRSQSS